MAEFMAVLEAAQRRSDALVAKDLDALDTLLHPNFTYVNTSGQVLSRQQYLDNYVIPDQIRWTSQQIFEPSFAGDGDAAVLICLVHDVAQFGDEVVTETFRSTLTWIRTERGWQCLAGHTSARTGGDQ